MIKMSYDMFLIILGMEFIVILIGQWISNIWKKEDYIKCNYIVISKSTGKEYNCIGIRYNEDHILEIRIFNHYVDEYQWYPYYKFDFKSK